MGGQMLCACGCGEKIVIKPFHKYVGIPKFIQYHHSRTIIKNKKIRRCIKCNKELNCYSERLGTKWCRDCFNNKRFSEKEYSTSDVIIMRNIFRKIGLKAKDVPDSLAWTGIKYAQVLRELNTEFNE